ncbi:MAG: DNA-binding transcriptional regulator [Deltaproteobacteria bacterium]
MTKSASRILDEMLETSRGLHQSNLIDKRKLCEIEALCQSTVEPMPPTAIKGLRETLHVSQPVFAKLLNTSVSTIQKWEVGDKRPSGPSLKLLNVVRRHGLETLS